MKINNSLEFNKVWHELKSQLTTINYNKDLYKLLENLEKLNNELGQLEVLARQKHNNNLTKDKLLEVNNAINYLEKMILMAKLMN